MLFKANGERTRRIVDRARRDSAALNTFVLARSRGRGTLDPGRRGV